MKLKASKPNPLEIIWSRRKFDILGKKREGEERRIGLAIQKANQTFSIPSNSAQRQLVLSKKSKYNLSDGEEDDDFEILGLHPLPQRDDFEDEMLSDNDG